MWAELICGLVLFCFVMSFFGQDDAVVDLDSSHFNSLFTVAKRLEKLYRGCKVYVGLQIPDPDSFFLQNIDLVLVTNQEAVVITVQSNISGCVSIDKDNNWVCKNANSNKIERFPDPVAKTKQLVPILEEYLEQRGVTLPEGYLSYKVICSSPNIFLDTSDAFPPEFITYEQWIKLLPEQKSSYSGCVKGALCGGKNKMQESFCEKLNSVLSNAPISDRLELKDGKFILGEFLEFKGTQNDLEKLRKIKRSEVSRLTIQPISIFGFVVPLMVEVRFSPRDYPAEGPSKLEGFSIGSTTEIVFQPQNSKKPLKIKVSSVVSMLFFGQESQDDAVVDLDSSHFDSLFTVAKRLEKFYRGCKVYVGLQIPDPDSASRQNIDLVLVTNQEAVVITVQSNISGCVSIDKDNNWVCTNAKSNKIERCPDPVTKTKQLVPILEEYLEQRGVTLPEGYLSYKVICPSPSIFLNTSDAFPPEFFTYDQWIKLLPEQKSSFSGCVKGALCDGKNKMQESFGEKLNSVLSTALISNRLELKDGKFILGEFLEFKGTQDDLEKLRKIERSEVSRLTIQPKSIFGSVVPLIVEVQFSPRDYRAEGTSMLEGFSIGSTTEIVFQPQNSKKPLKIKVSSVVSMRFFGQESQDDAVVDLDSSHFNSPFTVAKRLEKLYRGCKVYVGLQIPDPDSASRQNIDLVLVTNQEAVVINISRSVSIDKDNNWVCINAKSKKIERCPDPVAKTKQLVPILEEYLEQRGVTLPEGYLSYKVICPSPSKILNTSDAFPPEFITYEQWIKLLPEQKSSDSGWVKGALFGGRNKMQESFCQKLNSVLSTAPIYDRLELKDGKFILGEFLEFKGTQDDLQKLRKIKRSKVSRLTIQPISILGFVVPLIVKVRVSPRDYRAEGTSMLEGFSIGLSTEIVFQPQNSKKPLEYKVSSVVSMVLSA